MIELQYRDVDVVTGEVIKAGYVVYNRAMFQKIQWYCGTLKRKNKKEDSCINFVFGAEQENLERVKLLFQKQYEEYNIAYTRAVHRIKYEKQNIKITLEVKFCGLYKLTCKTERGTCTHDNLTYAKVKTYINTLVGAPIVSEVLSFLEQGMSQY